MLTTWMPSSADAATTAYVEPPISVTATPDAPASVSNPDAPSTAEETSAGRAGSVTLTMYMPPGLPATAATTYAGPPAAAAPSAAIPAPCPGSSLS